MDSNIYSRSSGSPSGASIAQVSVPAIAVSPEAARAYIQFGSRSYPYVIPQNPTPSLFAAIGNPFYSFPSSQTPQPYPTPAQHNENAHGVPQASYAFEDPQLQFESTPEEAVPDEPVGNSQPAPQSIATRPNGGNNNCLSWSDANVVQLLHLKRAQWMEFSEVDLRDIFVGGQAKWQMISNKLNEKGVQCNWRQAKAKWDALLGLYKRIKDYQGRSGSGNFFAMTSSERKSNELPAVFHEEWFEIIDSFMATRPSVRGPTPVDSSLGEGIDDLPESDAPSATATNEPPQSRGSGKRKRIQASAHNAAFLQAFKDMSSSMEKSLERRLIFETERFDRAESHRAVEMRAAEVRFERQISVDERLASGVVNLSKAVEIMANAIAHLANR
ncbi:hypothetical protein R1flu_009722 [Riccia fluitans]|uniref:Myb/SANT-like DNA-binding domain-containing protein n=1 Tax=Riccia fluitans TaxID=41844 RepID=A0ABD1Z2Y3_9MARC